MYPPFPTAVAAGRPFDPILGAYLLVACLPMVMAVLACGIKFLMTPDDAKKRVPGPRRCVGCGYDVRSTPDGTAVFGVCPECGRAVEPGSEAP